MLFLIYANYPSTLYNVKSDLFDLGNSFDGINERESRAWRRVSNSRRVLSLKDENKLAI